MSIVAGLVVALVLMVVWQRRHPSPYPARLAFLLDIPLRGLRPKPATLARRLAHGGQTSLLEIGPGSGVYTEALLALEPRLRLVCLDLQPEMLHKLRRRLGHRSPSLVCADASALPFRDRAFDRILLVSVLGEVPKRNHALSECARILSSDGAVLVAESVIDPDYVAPRTLVREAHAAGLVAIDRTGPWMSYSQRLARQASSVPK
jgi:ubiquinone/menaquinone biosynthesis C-methylase UbiE